MTRLSDIQLVLLAAAAQRPDGSLLPPPENLGDQATRLTRTIRALLKHDLVAEGEVTDLARSWRQEDARHIGVFITDAGRSAIGLEPPAAAAVGDDQHAQAVTPKQEQPTTADAAPTSARASSKAAQVISLLRREGGATLDELVAATGWLPHTTRAALTGLRKKGHAITRGKRGNVSCYSIAAAA